MSFSALLESTHPAVLVVYAALTFIGLYTMYGLLYGLDGGGSKGRWWVFKCFLEDLLDSIPGGMDRKVARLKEMVGTAEQGREGAFMGHIRTWRYEDLRLKGGWEDCARGMWPPAWVFWAWFAVSTFFAPIFGVIGTFIFMKSYFAPSLPPCTDSRCGECAKRE